MGVVKDLAGRFWCAVLARSFASLEDDTRGEGEEGARLCGGSKPPPYQLKCEAVAEMVQNLTRAPSVFCFAKSTSLPEGGLGADGARYDFS